MQMNFLRPVRILLGLLVTLGASLPLGAVASNGHITTADMNPNRQASVADAEYAPPARASRAVYTTPIVERVSAQVAAPNVGENEVGAWKLLVAVVGLIGIRLWHAGKKSLPLIG